MGLILFWFCCFRFVFCFCGVVLTWTAGILEICCSLRGKKSFCGVVFVCWCVCFCSGLVSLLHDPSHPHSLHTKAVKFFTCLSERALAIYVTSARLS